MSDDNVVDLTPDTIVYECTCGSQLFFFREDWSLECPECGEMFPTADLIED